MDIDIIQSNSNIDNNTNTNTTTSAYQPPITPQINEHKKATADKDKAVSYDYIYYKQWTKNTTKDIICLWNTNNKG